MKKQRIKPYKKLLYVEDGSIEASGLDDLRDANPEILVIVYRQGAMRPELVDIKNGGKKVWERFYLEARE